MGEAWGPKHEKKYPNAAFDTPDTTNETDAALLQTISRAAEVVVRELIQKEDEEPLPRDTTELYMMYMAALDERFEEAGIFMEAHGLLQHGHEKAWENVRARFDALRVYVKESRAASS